MWAISRSTPLTLHTLLDPPAHSPQPQYTISTLHALRIYSTLHTPLHPPPSGPSTPSSPPCAPSKDTLHTTPHHTLDRARGMQGLTSREFCQSAALGSAIGALAGGAGAWAETALAAGSVLVSAEATTMASHTDITLTHQLHPQAPASLSRTDIKHPPHTPTSPSCIVIVLTHQHHHHTLIYPFHLLAFW